MRRKVVTFLGIVLTSALVSTGASYGSYLYHKNEGELNARSGLTGYKKLAPFGFDTILSPMGAFCDCFIQVDTPTGNSAVTTSIIYEAIAVNTFYLFVPLAILYTLHNRGRKKPRRLYKA